MMVPTRPMAHLIIRQPGFALAALEACFDAMFRFGHPSTFPQWRLRDSVGQIIIHLHHLLVVSVAVAEHHQDLLVALLTPMGARYHTTFHRLDHQRAFGTIAHIDPAPALIRQRLTPRLVVFDGTANTYRSPKAASRRRNHAGRPISSSPAIQLCGRPAPFFANIAKANWCRVREPLYPGGTPALSRRALSLVHAVGRESRVSTSVWP